MNKTIKIEIPEELTIVQYNNLGNLEHLTELEKRVRVIHSISGHSEEEIMQWDLESLTKIYTDINDIVQNIDPIFLPVFEFKGIKYGIQPLSKMTGGEYISLEKQLEKGDILNAIAILYRPIKKERFDSFKWHLKSSLKFIKGKSEDLFKYFTIEEYDTETVEWRKDIFQDLPVSVALGAYTFFLLIGMQYSNSILQSLKGIPQMEKMMMNQEIEKVLANIGVGSTLSMDLQKTGESLDSQE